MNIHPVFVFHFYFGVCIRLKSDISLINRKKKQTSEIFGHEGDMEAGKLSSCHWLLIEACERELEVLRFHTALTPGKNIHINKR